MHVDSQKSFLHNKRTHNKLKKMTHLHIVLETNRYVRLRPPRSSGHLGVWIEGHNVHVADSMDRGTLKDRDRIGSRVYHVGCALPPYSTQLDLYNAAGVGAVDASHATIEVKSVVRALSVSQPFCFYLLPTSKYGTVPILRC